MNRNFLYLLASAVCFLSGAAFYLHVRGYLFSPMWPIYQTSSARSLEWLSGCFPSFIHALALMLLSAALDLSRRRAIQSGFVLGIGFEVAQAIFSHGTFDVADLIAAALGITLGAVLYVGPSLYLISHRKFFLCCLYGFGLFTSIATSPAKTYNIAPKSRQEPPIISQSLPYAAHDPVYMTYEDLRQAFAVEKPRPVKKAGKILVVGSTLLINEPNIGVHIFDNTDPAQPEAKSFLSIPGNVDLAAKSGIVYADSFIDLVAIRLEGEEPELVHRVENTFLWNPYQTINDPSIHFDPEKLDKDLGVVVGARPKDEGSE